MKKRTSFLGGMLVLSLMVAASILRAANPSAAAAAGNTYYVSPNGSDSNAGTLAQPWATFQHAADIAVAGDTVLFRGGTYQLGSTVNLTSHSGAAGSPITFKNYPGESPTFVGDRTDATWAIVYVSNVSNILLDGLKATGANYPNFSIVNASYVTIQNCESYGANQQGIYVSTERANTVNRYITLSHNYVHDNAWEGIYIKNNNLGVRTDHVTVEGNTITGNGMEAVQNTVDPNYQSSVAAPSFTVIRGNTIHHNQGDWGIMDLVGDSLVVEDNFIYSNQNSRFTDSTTGIAYMGGSGTAIRNNVIFNDRTNWPSDAALWISNASNLSVYNNTIDNNNAGYDAIHVGALSGSISIEDNILSDIAGQQILFDQPTDAGRTTLDYNLVSRTDALFGNHNKVGNPQYVSIPNLDFQLTANSPAIDAGTNTGVTTDMDGVTRPQGAAYDMGAYEFTGQSPATPSPTVTPTRSPSPTPTNTPTRTPSITPSPTPTTTGTPSPPPPPGPFTKASPLTGATDEPARVTLSWNSAAGAVEYLLCLGTTNDAACPSGWKGMGAALAKTFSLSRSTTYYWQVLANDGGSQTPADGGTWWSFSTRSTGNFRKLAPGNRATNQPTNLTLSWNSKPGTLHYELCLRTSKATTCPGGWQNIGVALSKSATLAPGTTYYWEVRAFDGANFTPADRGVWYSLTTGLLPTFADIP